MFLVGGCIEPRYLLLYLLRHISAIQYFLYSYDVAVLLFCAVAVFQHFDIVVAPHCDGIYLLEAYWILL